MNVHTHGANSVGAARKASRSGQEMSTGMTLKALKSELDGLQDSALDATSVVEFSGFGANKQYQALIVVKDDHERPRCPSDPLPMNNRALKNTVDALVGHYGKKAEGKKLAFLSGGMPRPGVCEVTLEGTGLGLPFYTRTGQPMGVLTGGI